MSNFDWDAFGIFGKMILIGMGIVAVVCFIFFQFFASDLEGVRSYGGEITIELEPNLKLLDIEWNEDDLWIKSRPMREDEEAEEYVFTEQSGHGIIQGTIYVKEIKTNNKDIKTEEIIEEETKMAIKETSTEETYYTTKYNLEDIISN